MDACLATLTHSLDECLRGRARFKNVLRIGEGLVSRAYGGDLGGENLLAVQENLDTIRPPDGRGRIRLHRRGEGRILDRDLRKHERTRTPDTGDDGHGQHSQDQEHAEPIEERFRLHTASSGDRVKECLSRSPPLVSSLSAKDHVAPVMVAVKTRAGRIPLAYAASAEHNAPLFGVGSQLGRGKSIHDGHHAPRPTRWAENRLPSSRT
jgi:hypothetical protein